jgi:5'-nucleotidase
VKKLFNILLMLFVMASFSPRQITHAQSLVCDQDVVVQADDWLSKIADKVYGDILAFPAIVEATNAAASSDDSYTVIDNPDVIEVGQKLCVPSVEEAAVFMESEAAKVEGGTMTAPEGTVPLQILAINDFHGNIASTSSSFGGTGRADYLSTNIQSSMEGVDNSIFVSAGDLIGASPLISALFHDEPTIEAMNLIGLDINAVGNHEFDEGPAELLRLQTGGSHPVDGDLDGDPFAGAEFEFLAANVVFDETGETIFPAYTVREYGGVQVAFIGMTLEGTPAIVTSIGVAGLTFNDEAETVNALVPQLQADGIEAIVVLLHEGGFSPGGQNDCEGGLTGAVADIVPQFDDAVDLVITGHTNDEFICEIDGKWVTMADTAGRLFTDIDVALDPETKDMTVVAINNVPNLQEGVTPDPTLTALIDKYDENTAPLANVVIGTVTDDILREQNDAGESALGDIIADAQLAATSSPTTGEAVIAFMNSGGIRDDIFFAASGPEADGELTFGESFSVQPFGNSLVTMSLTGAQIHAVLEQ